MLKFSVFQGFKAAQIKLHSDVSWVLQVIKLYIICAKGRTYLAKHILLQVIPDSARLASGAASIDLASSICPELLLTR